MALLSEKVASQIREEIASGKYSEGTRLEPVRQLCEKFGVSRRTINSALDVLAGDGLITKLPRRGIEVVKNLPRSAVNGGGAVGAIMFVRLRQDDNTYALTKGIQRCAAENHDRPTIVDALSSYERVLDALREPPRGVAGLLLQVYDQPDFIDAVARDYQQGLRIVCIGRVVKELDCSSVTSDNFSGGYQATEHLLETHDVPVHYITYRDGPSSARDRRKGWARAMRLHGFDDCQDYLLVLPSSEYDLFTRGKKAEERCYQQVLQLVKRQGEEPMSIFAVNDAVAGMVYLACDACGRRVGKNVFVVGFDNLPLCRRLDPPLSSVHQSVEQLGYEGAKLLYEEIEGDHRKPIHKVISTHLEIRPSSTG